MDWAPSVCLRSRRSSSLLGLYAAPAIIRAAAFRPYALIRDAQYGRLISSGFVHASISHLLFNLLTFYFFAFTLERRIGTLPFVTLYGLGLLIGNLSTYFKHRNEPDYVTLGASGAVSAVLFASIVYFPTMRLYILPLPVPIPAVLFAVLYLGFSYYQARQSADRVNHDAHIGGALTRTRLRGDHPAGRVRRVGGRHSGAVQLRVVPENTVFVKGKAPRRGQIGRDSWPFLNPGRAGHTNAGVLVRPWLPPEETRSSSPATTWNSDRST